LQFAHRSSKNDAGAGGVAEWCAALHITATWSKSCSSASYFAPHAQAKGNSSGAGDASD
jgi:hypothetical protein